MKPVSAIAFLFLALPTLASANDVDDAITKFIGAPGYQRLEAMDLERELDTLWLDSELVSPGGAVGPLEKAVLLAAGAIPSSRTRTAIAYGEMIDEQAGPVSFVDLRHYNLGPQIRLEAIASYGDDNVAPADEFGLGDHIAWRFVFTPMMNNAAILRDVSRRIISEDDAADDDCSGRPCLDPYASFEDIAEWQAVDSALPDWPAQYPNSSDQQATPAYAIAQLAVLGFWANAESGSYQWTGGEHPEAARNYQPYRFIDIDRDLGQDLMIDTVWRETLLNDDALSEVLFRRFQAGEVYLMQASVPR
ncbi:hypothetical protein [Pelagibacterium sp.]|uniref:hypothetical protein n=1 Tax=Pelagibacterium sp. TaxID=1967288 RepID=UPI003A94EA0B